MISPPFFKLLIDKINQVWIIFIVAKTIIKRNKIAFIKFKSRQKDSLFSCKWQFNKVLKLFF